MTRGLARECRSFESVSCSGYYLRHQKGRIRIDEADDNRLFLEDSTFCLRPGLANSNDFLFESYK
jgi:hypothetical protein